MIKQLQKKFLTFSVIVILFSANANAQMIYTDLNPDVTISDPNSYSIDFNNDGIIDVNLNADAFFDRSTGGSGRPPFSRVTAKSILNQSSQVLTTSSGNTTYGLNLDANSLVGDESQTWSTSSVYLNDLSVCSFCWPQDVDRFLGVRFSVGGNWFYGWVRLSTFTARGRSRFTVRDYAYNPVPNQPILAGQTSALGINENSLASKTTIFPNPASNQVTISLGSLQQEVEVSITDTTGKTVYKIKESERQNIAVNTKDFASGIYLVKIKAKDFITTKKLVVNK